MGKTDDCTCTGVSLVRGGVCSGYHGDTKAGHLTEPYGRGDSCVRRTRQGRLPGEGNSLFEFKMV